MEASVIERNWAVNQHGFPGPSSSPVLGFAGDKGGCIVSPLGVHDPVVKMRFSQVNSESPRTLGAWLVGLLHCCNTVTWFPSGVEYLLL